MGDFHAAKFSTGSLFPPIGRPLQQPGSRQRGSATDFHAAGGLLFLYLEPGSKAGGMVHAVKEAHERFISPVK